MSSQTQWNQSYYGQPFAARQLVMQMQGGNAGADPLRDVLTRYGSTAANAPLPLQQQQPGFAPSYPPYQPQGAQPAQTPTLLTPPPSQDGRGPIQQQNLSAPNR